MLGGISPSVLVPKEKEKLELALKECIELVVGPYDLCQII